MKVTVMFLMMALNFLVLAQSAEVIDRAPQNYEKALKSDKPSMVESALFHAVKFKLHYPEQNTAKLLKQVNKLASTSDSPVIRYKAYLAAQFLEETELLSQIEPKDYKDAEAFFKQLGDELQKSRLASN